MLDSTERSADSSATTDASAEERHPVGLAADGGARKSGGGAGTKKWKSVRRLLRDKAESISPSLSSMGRKVISSNRLRTRSKDERNDDRKTRRDQERRHRDEEKGGDRRDGACGVENGDGGASISEETEAESPPKSDDGDDGDDEGRPDAAPEADESPQAGAPPEPREREEGEDVKERGDGVGDNDAEKDGDGRGRRGPPSAIDERGGSSSSAGAAEGLRAAGNSPPQDGDVEDEVTAAPEGSSAVGSAEERGGTGNFPREAQGVDRGESEGEKDECATATGHDERSLDGGASDKGEGVEPGHDVPRPPPFGRSGSTPKVSNRKVNPPLGRRKVSFWSLEESDDDGGSVDGDEGGALGEDGDGTLNDDGAPALAPAPAAEVRSLSLVTGQYCSDAICNVSVGSGGARGLHPSSLPPPPPPKNVAYSDSGSDSDCSISIDDGNDSSQWSIDTNQSSRRTALMGARSLHHSREYLNLVVRERFVDWAGSLRRRDPRYQILTFFDDVARDGGVKRGVSFAMNQGSGPGGGDSLRIGGVERGGNLRSIGEGEAGGGCGLISSLNSAVMNPHLTSPLLRFFSRAGVFTVWRPCSKDAIRAMMTGKATGKGLDVKGKSAKRGKLSGYVPFVQIHDESHKDQVAYVPDGVRMRCFYGRECDRDNAAEYLERFAEECVGRDNDFGRVRVYSRDDWVAAGCVTKIDTYARGEGGDGSGDEKEGTKAEDGNDSSKYSDDGCDSSNRIRRGSTDSFDRRCKLIRNLSTRRASVESERSGKAAAQMIKPCWGLECPQSLFWESIVRSRPVRRLPGSDLDTGRPSEPAFQDMNLKTVRVAEDGGDDIDCPSRTAVVWQPPDACGDDPLDPRTLLVAYEERGRVLPVVSDFDCFTVGTRGVPYNRPLPPEQVGLVEWSVERVGGILDAQAERRRRREERAKETLGEAKPDEAKEPSWTAMWLDVLKRATSDPEDTASDVPIPPYGYGDGTSYSMMGRAVERLDCGAVRHGAECFNYKFPQELDRQFLIVSDTLPGNVPWKYVSEPELREFMIRKVDEGFSFPLNPKWVLCDPGWKGVYDKLKDSTNSNVKTAMAVWFPPSSSVRKLIEEVCERHPRGFLRDETRPRSFKGSRPRANGGAGDGSECPLLSAIFSDRDSEYDDDETDDENCGREAIDLAELQLGRYMALQRAKRKLSMGRLPSSRSGTRNGSDPLRSGILLASHPRGVI